MSGGETPVVSEGLLVIDFGSRPDVNALLTGLLTEGSDSPTTWVEENTLFILEQAAQTSERLAEEANLVIV